MMTPVRMESTEDYEELRAFFIENGLEFDEDEARPDIVKMWRMTHGQGDLKALVGGAVLTIKNGEFCIEGIAIDRIYRKLGLGKVLIKKACEEVKNRGGKRIVLLARAPGFYRKLGFSTIPNEESPIEFDCFTCPQNGVDCFPAVMALDID